MGQDLKKCYLSEGRETDCLYESNSHSRQYFFQGCAYPCSSDSTMHRHPCPVLLSAAQNSVLPMLSQWRILFRPFFIDSWDRAWNHFALMDSSSSFPHVSVCKNARLTWRSPGMGWEQFCDVSSSCQKLPTLYSVCRRKTVMDEAFIHLGDPLIFMKSWVLSVAIALFSKTGWYYMARFLYEFSQLAFFFFFF